MIAIIAFHVVMLVLALGVIGRVVSEQRVSNMLGYVHKSIGITSPSAAQVRIVSLVWIGSVVIIVDGCILLLVSIAKLSTAR